MIIPDNDIEDLRHKVVNELQKFRRLDMIDARYRASLLSILEKIDDIIINAKLEKDNDKG